MRALPASRPPARPPVQAQLNAIEPRVFGLGTFEAFKQQQQQQQQQTPPAGAVNGSASTAHRVVNGHKYLLVPLRTQGLSEEGECGVRVVGGAVCGCWSWGRRGGSGRQGRLCSQALWAHY
jgi:hypothetical protein